MQSSDFGGRAPILKKSDSFLRDTIHHVYVFDVMMIGEKPMSTAISEYKAGSSACDINRVPFNETCQEGEIDGK